MARGPSVVLAERAIRPLIRVARKAAITGRSCPACGSYEVRRSARWGFLDGLLLCLFLLPFRCRVCRVRFYRVWRPALKASKQLPLAPVLMMPRQMLEIDPREPHPSEPPRTHSVPRLVELPPITAQPARFTRARSILILENDLSIRKLLCRLLERRGYFVHEVMEAGDLAVELRERRVDLLIVADGLSSALALAHLHPNLKILALSLEPMDGAEFPDRCLALGKPFSLDMFLECVDRLIEPA